MKRKAELTPVTIIVMIVVIGLVIFFAIKWSGILSSNEVAENVTALNDSQIIVNSSGIAIYNNPKLPVNDTANRTLVRVIYPNRTMTPGAIMSSNITEICVTGYSDSVRNVSNSMRDAVYTEYKLSTNQPTGAFEIDHLVPLSIGGSNDITNLWPQPAEPRPGYKEKDVLENYYHRQVCAGKMDLREAQAMMANNWFQGYLDAKVAGGIK